MRFHKDIYMPEYVSRFARRGILPLTYGHHAIKATRRHKGISVPVLPSIDTSKADVIEVEFIDGKYHKTLYRIAGIDVDIILAVMYNGIVKTTWVNEKNDQHSTLDRNMYVHSDSDCR